MKKIAIKNFKKPDKSSIYTKFHSYQVFLNFGQKASFKTVIEAKSFIDDANKMLNALAYEINSYIIDVTRIYVRSSMYGFSIDFSNNISESIQCFNRAFKGMNSENANTIPFLNLSRTVSRLLNVLESLIPYLTKKRLFELRDEAKFYNCKLEEASYILTNFSKKKASD